jgi:protein-L-isoaspartate(D-aspartate) O-methyltransferase
VTKLPPVNTDSTRASVHSDQDADELRGALVDQIIARHEQLGLTLPREVEAALRRVPRHLFTPGVPLGEAYADDSIVTKKNERGVSVSAVSAPSVIARMLGQLQVAPGQRVLEIGSGGYNAALLRELVGPDGSVTTIDIDQEVVDRARGCLTTAGYGDVRALCTDGEFGAAKYGPFDRIIVTVGAWDIPPAWVDQLAEGGRLVVPLRTRGMTRSWALEHCGGHLVSRDHAMCGFVPMRGVGEHRGREIPLHGEEVGLWTDEEQKIDAASLEGVLSAPRSEVWSGVTVRKREQFSDQDLWLATTLSGFCLLTARQEAVDRRLVSPSWYLITPALLDGTSLGYCAKLRPVNPEQSVSEFGAYAHGPNADKVADRLVEQIRIWDRDHRHGPGPRLTVYPAGTTTTDLPAGFVLDKRHTRIVISWPELTR